MTARHTHRRMAHQCTRTRLPSFAFSSTPVPIKSPQPTNISLVDPCPNQVPSPQIYTSLHAEPRQVLSTRVCVFVCACGNRLLPEKWPRLRETVQRENSCKEGRERRRASSHSRMKPAQKDAKVWYMKEGSGTSSCLLASSAMQSRACTTSTAGHSNASMLHEKARRADILFCAAPC